jgi:peptidoglycan hydrolase-like protein with peptidoglycan-binding domain
LVEQNIIPSKYVTGYYGKITETAVKSLQSKYNIVNYGTPSTTGYGAVGPKTRKVINSL